jgi:hypothetical protein
MLVLTEDLATNDLALFSSQFPGYGPVGVQVSFTPITKNKAHLVEFQLTLNEPQKGYKFRVMTFPLGNYQDVTVSSQQPLYTIVPAVDAEPIELGAQIMQQNTIADKAGWVFRSVRITSVS